MNLRAIWALGVALLASGTATGLAEPTRVFNPNQLKLAIERASPGEIIMIMPGLYEMGRLNIQSAGTPERPITVTAPALGDVKIVPKDDEVFKVAAPYWIFENLDIGGGPTSEHAFHLVGSASHVIIRHDFLHDLNAMIKGNGEGEPRKFPDHVLIEDNILLDTAPRTGDAPVTPIDVVGGKAWVVRGNFIADFAKAGGDHVSYGAFLKGNSSEGILERNLVLCEWKTHGGVRIGLSFGGGGTGEGLCDGVSCVTEHRNGIIRSNIIANCPEDVGIYLNKATDTKILNNTLFDTNGIDIRFPTSSARIDGNIISGGMRSRDGGTFTTSSNLLFGLTTSMLEQKGLAWLEEKILGGKQYPSVLPAEWTNWLAGRGDMESILENTSHGNLTLRSTVENTATVPSPEVVDDFCGFERDSRHPSFGAIELRDESCYVPMAMLRAESMIVRDRQW